MTKPELRKIARERLARLTSAEVAEKSAVIAQRVAAHAAWRKAATVCLFAALGTEPDLDALWLDAAGKRICYPRVEGNELELVAVSGPGALGVSRWNLREPARAESEGILLAEMDLVLVPGLAFTRDGGRLGRGGGFYDRLLARPLLKARRIGVCFEAQIVESVPLEGHDERVDEVLTERP